MFTAWHSIVADLPLLLLHLATTIALLLGALAIYLYYGPYHELQLIRKGNVAAAVVLSGQGLALAIPLGVIMANSISAAEIVGWGIVTILLQLIASVALRLAIHQLPKLIEQGAVAPALIVAVTQIAAGLFNAAAMAPTTAAWV